MGIPRGLRPGTCSCYTSPMDHAGRLRRLRSALGENDLDSLLVTHLPNIHYLCGFTGSAAALLVADHGAILFTDGRYRTQAKEEVNAARIVIASKSPLVAAAEWLATNNERRSSTAVGIEPGALTAR